MNKKLMAVAVAGALAVPAVAFAQASSVQIYGRANLGIGQYQATGATAGSANDWKSRYQVYDSSSRLGFTGTEDLGNGLKAIFLMESGVNIDNGGTTGQSGAANTSSGTLSSRIGHVGLAGGWGQVTFGRSNVWWANGAIEQTGANYVNTGINFLSGGFGRGMAVGVARVSNVVQYSSPVFGGAQLIGSYAPQSENAAAGAKANGSLWGITAQGQWGPFRAGFDYVENEVAEPATGSRGKIIGTKARFGWQYMPGGQISLLGIQSENKNGFAPPGTYGGLPDATAGITLKQRGWGVNWEHMFGSFQALAQYGDARNITGCSVSGACNNTNGKSYMLGGRYLFSKRTAVYLTWNETRNASNYNMDYTNGSITSASAATNPGAGAGLGAASVGADPRVWALGIQHNF